ncbi:MAG: enoyl-CoA hydratase/isomerase family protein [Acidibrevibacterium sp.]|jgi:enoyl-CoA hydratase/carnithine racemase|uniref:enoyl-CoA hydratase/isomerase family protein n=1 Tax=Acidibrevibacterium fodinaquatile TaxID=1969806 RepID=UPI0023A81B22|nr:enoyl-CoA hydratase/isomerase family protein [Acidibrevibacterium fodinaquatile]MCA7120135.1 enoyl-CoA hydratase/isomerase family protein [Acidibrevibacterium fodinaquatile]
MTDTANLRVWHEGRVGRLELNRPRALNALDLGMIAGLAEALAGWREAPAVQAVLITGAGERAFCAGGDIRAIREAALAGEGSAIERFFADEYALNEGIASYPKPYIALIDGICMGGGIGVSVHGDIRVTSEHGRFAMPETGIGFFPDIGASYFLPRLPGELGMYLALTGAELRGADAVYAGLATHFVPRAAFPDLERAIIADGPAAVAGFAAPLPPFSLAPHRALIDRCFGEASVPEILAALEAAGTAFAEETLKTLSARSPSALAWSFALLRRGAARTLSACLAQELALTRRITRHPDFLEGVRAMVVDKDRAPRWQPATLAEVDPAAIAALFA